MMRHPETRAERDAIGLDTMPSPEVIADLVLHHDRARVIEARIRHYGAEPFYDAWVRGLGIDAVARVLEERAR